MADLYNKYNEVLDEIKEMEVILVELKEKALQLKTVMYRGHVAPLYELLDIMFSYCDNEELEGVAYTYTKKKEYIAIRLEEIFENKETRKYLAERLLRLSRLNSEIKPGVVSFKGKSKRCYVMSLDAYERLKMYSHDMIE